MLCNILKWLNRFYKGEILTHESRRASSGRLCRDQVWKRLPSQSSSGPGPAGCILRLLLRTPQLPGVRFAKHVPEFQDVGTQELQYYLPKVLEELTTVQGPTCPSPGKPSQTHSLKGTNSPLSAPSLFLSLSISDKTVHTALWMLPADLAFNS